MDKVYEGFLKQQYEEGMALAASSDLFKLIAADGDPPQRYLAIFHCKGLVRRDGEIREASDFAVQIWFPDNYVREPVSPVVVTQWFDPPDVWHPNIRAPFICIGPIAPGTSLKELIHRIFEVITYQKVTVVESDALNKEACPWARGNQDMFPIDRRPLKRRQLQLDVTLAEEEIRS